MRKAFFICLLLSLSLPGSNARSQSFSPAQKFLNEAVKRRALSARAKENRARNADVVIHFFWTSWCEFCEKAYSSLTQMQNEPAFQNRIEIIGYCLDAQMTDKVREKLATMNSIDEYLLAPKLVQEIPEFGRMPAFVVEDKQRHRLEAYTGFSNERFRYLKKFVSKALKIEDTSEE